MTELLHGEPEGVSDPRAALFAFAIAVTLSELICALGATVRTVHDGPSALREVQQAAPTVGLLDIGMPGMDGYEVARRLRSAPGASGILLIALTGWGQLNDREAAIAAGFTYHWVKPVTFKQLKAFSG